jgi:caffeoyl-CoA O-methyltransferase
MDALEQYLSEHYWSEDDLLREVRLDIEQRGPAIQVSAEAGRLLALLVRAAAATRVLEVGTLFGYSGIWMARELAGGGHMDTIEIETLHADAAEHWFERAGLADHVLPSLPGPYDVAFIDADKKTYPEYARQSLQKLRPGGILIADNAIRSGRVVQAGLDADMDGTRAMHDLLGGDANLVSTTVPVGDGLAIAVKRS